MAGTAEVGDDGRQRGGHDRLVEGGQQHAEQHRNEDEVAALRADPALLDSGSETAAVGA